jgi:hypothetical protein
MLSVGVYLWGQLLTTRTALSVATTPEAERVVVVRRVIMQSGVELLGLIVIFTLMVLMHFSEEHGAASRAVVSCL